MFLHIAVCLVAMYLLYWRYRAQRISHYTNKYVLITGCDSGFGFMLAKKLASLGINVFATCLTPEGIDNLRKETPGHVTILQMDVSKEASIKAAKNEVESRLPADQGLWAVVNNAGIFGPAGVSDWFILEDYRRVMEVDFYGLVEVTRIFLPLVRKSKGRIVNMTSIMGRIGLGGAPYAAAKYAAEGYSDVLRRELYNSNVTVHIIEPGPFKTSIANSQKMVDSIKYNFQRLDKDTQTYFGNEFEETLSRLTRNGLDAAVSPRTHKVIDAYTDAITAKYPKPRYLVGYDAEYFYPIVWSLPEFISDFMFGIIMPIPLAVQKLNGYNKDKTE